MKIYTQLYSTYLFDGKKILCDTPHWGALTMTDPELKQFELDMKESVNHLTNNEHFSTEIIYSSETDSIGNKIAIGQRYTLQDTYVGPTDWESIAHPKYLQWQTVFANDPNCIEFRPIVQEL
jgi:hypothetical protein